MHSIAGYVPATRCWCCRALDRPAWAAAGFAHDDLTICSRGSSVLRKRQPGVESSWPPAKGRAQASRAPPASAGAQHGFLQLGQPLRQHYWSPTARIPTSEAWHRRSRFPTTRHRSGREAPRCWLRAVSGAPARDGKRARCGCARRARAQSSSAPSARCSPIARWALPTTRGCWPTSCADARPRTGR